MSARSRVTVRFNCRLARLLYWGQAGQQIYRILSFELVSCAAARPPTDNKCVFTPSRCEFYWNRVFAPHPNPNPVTEVFPRPLPANMDLWWRRLTVVTCAEQHKDLRWRGAQLQVSWSMVLTVFIASIPYTYCNPRLASIQSIWPLGTHIFSLRHVHEIYTTHKEPGIGLYIDYQLKYRAHVYTWT